MLVDLTRTGVLARRLITAKLDGPHRAKGTKARSARTTKIAEVGRPTTSETGRE